MTAQAAYARHLEPSEGADHGNTQGQPTSAQLQPPHLRDNAAHGGALQHRQQPPSQPALEVLSYQQFFPSGYSG